MVPEACIRLSEMLICGAGMIWKLASLWKLLVFLVMYGGAAGLTPKNTIEIAPSRKKKESGETVFQ